MRFLSKCLGCYGKYIYIVILQVGIHTCCSDFFPHAQNRLHTHLCTRLSNHCITHVSVGLFPHTQNRLHTHLCTHSSNHRITHVSVGLFLHTQHRLHTHLCTRSSNHRITHVSGTFSPHTEQASHSLVYTLIKSPHHSCEWDFFPTHRTGFTLTCAHAHQITSSLM